MKTLLASSIVIGIALTAPVQASQLSQPATVPGISTIAQNSGQAAPATIQLAARSHARTRSFRRLGSSGRRHVRGFAGPRRFGRAIRNRTSGRHYASAHRRMMRARARAAIRRARLRNRGRF